MYWCFRYKYGSQKVAGDSYFICLFFLLQSRKKYRESSVVQSWHLQIIQWSANNFFSSRKYFANDSQKYLSQIYWLIFRSQIDSYSYLPHSNFLNIFPIWKNNEFTNIITIHKYLQTIHEYLILISNVKISYYGFVCQVSCSKWAIYMIQEQEIMRKKGEEQIVIKTLRQETKCDKTQKC